MKRTRNYVKRFWIPAKKRKADGTFEKTMISPRIKDIHSKLCDILREQHSAEAFLKYLEDEDVRTQDELKEVAQLEDGEDSEFMLHIACAELDVDNNLEASIKVLRILLEADSSSIYAQNFSGVNPLRCLLVSNKSPERGHLVKLLLDSDPLKSTLLEHDGIHGGNLPLHNAVNGKSIGLPLSTIKLLYKSERSKEILDNRNLRGETPIYAACLNKHNAFRTLAEDRIQLLGGFMSWRQRLSKLIGKYQELSLLLDDVLYMQRLYILADDHLERSFRRWLMEFFDQSVSEIEEELPEVITLLQLAVWKGRELPMDAKERKRRWITCGAHHIARGVAEYLGKDSIGELQAVYDRIKKEVDERPPIDYSDNLSDSDEEEASSDDDDDDDEEEEELSDDEESDEDE